MSSLFGKNDGYSRLDRATNNIRDEDEQLISGIESADHQATFDFRITEDAFSLPGPSTLIDNIPRPPEPEPPESLIEIETNGPTSHGAEAFPNIGELSFHRGISKQVSLSDYQSNVETEETLKCIVTTLLFIGIVVTLIVVAFTINPSI